MVRNNRVERFCQQCSRFHAVHEFEGDRRSCRTQLERHNARRRKQRAAAAARSSAAAAASAADGGDADSRPARRQRLDAPAGDAATADGALGSPLEHPGTIAASEHVHNPATAAAATPPAVPSGGTVSGGNSDTSWPLVSPGMPGGSALHMPPGPEPGQMQSSCCGAGQDGCVHGDGRQQAAPANGSLPQLAQQLHHPSMVPMSVFTSTCERPMQLALDADLQGSFRDMKPSGSALMQTRQADWSVSDPVATARPAANGEREGLADGGGLALIQQIFSQPRVARALRRVLLPVGAPYHMASGAADGQQAWAPAAFAAARGDRTTSVLDAASMHLGAGTLPDGARSTLRISAKLWGCTPDSLPANLQDAVLSWVQVCSAGSLAPTRDSIIITCARMGAAGHDYTPSAATRCPCRMPHLRVPLLRREL